MKEQIEAINKTYQSIVSITTVINNFVLDIKNDKLQKLCTKMLSDYDLLIDECKLISNNNYNDNVKLRLRGKFK